MKKIYTKPEIMFENFSLSTNISAGCEEITNLPSAEEGCGFLPDGRWAGGIIFNDDGSGNCQSTPSGQYDSLCYHAPYEAYNLFSS